MGLGLWVRGDGSGAMGRRVIDGRLWVGGLVVDMIVGGEVQHLCIDMRADMRMRMRMDIYMDTCMDMCMRMRMDSCMEEC